MISLIREAQYEQTMRDVVEPKLAALREEIELPLADGVLHAEIYCPQGASRAVLLLHGYTESAEKLREMTAYFLEAGYSVFVPDHRGHGRSARAVSPSWLTHIDRFSDYVDDVGVFVERVVLLRIGNLPLDLFAHSMGGAVGALALMRWPDRFSRAVLNAPMIAAHSKGYPREMAWLMAAGMCLLGRGKACAFVGRPFDPAREKFEKSHDTSRARFDYYQKKRVEHAHLQNCAPTYAWVREAMAVTWTLLSRKRAGAIWTPVLLVQAERDSSVKLPEQERFAALVPGAKLLKLDTKHETYMSDDATMAVYLTQILRFLTGDAALQVE